MVQQGMALCSGGGSQRRKDEADGVAARPRTNRVGGHILWVGHPRRMWGRPGAGRHAAAMQRAAAVVAESHRKIVQVP